MGGAHWPDSGDGSQGCRLQEGSPGKIRLLSPKMGLDGEHLKLGPTTRSVGVQLPTEGVTRFSYLNLYLLWRFTYSLMIQRRKMLYPANSFHLHLHFPSLVWVQGIFSRFPASKANCIYGVSLCSGHGGGGASCFGSSLYKHSPPC